MLLLAGSVHKAQLVHNCFRKDELFGCLTTTKGKHGMRGDSWSWVSLAERFARVFFADLPLLVYLKSMYTKLVVIVNAHSSVDKRRLLHSINDLRFGLPG